MMPGLSDKAAMPEGSSCASARDNPSIPHLLAQYGATSLSVERPQPELKFTITPLSRLTIAGAKCRMTFAVPLRLTSITLEKSVALTSQSRAFGLMTPALLSKRSGGPCAARQLAAHIFTASSDETSTA